MTEPHRPRVKYVIGPDGSPLTIADLPAPGTKRWVIRRKAEVVAAVRGGLLSLEEACAPLHADGRGIPLLAVFDRPHGLAGLRTTRIQQYRSSLIRPLALAPRRLCRRRLDWPACFVAAHRRDVINRTLTINWANLAGSARTALVPGGTYRCKVSSISSGRSVRRASAAMARGHAGADRLFRLPDRARDGAADGAAVHRPVARGFRRRS